MSILHKDNSKKPWQVTWRLGPKRKRTSFKSLDSALAFDAACTQMAQAYGALLGKEPRENQGKSLRVAELARIYIAQLANPLTRKNTSYHLRGFLSVFGRKLAHCLTVADCTAWITKERARGMANSTIRARLAVVRTFYRWAVAGGVLPSNPLSNLKLPAAKPCGEAPPTRQEIARIFRDAPEHLCRVIVLGLTTGARIGPSELFRLKWEHVHLQEGYIAMPQASKGAKSKIRRIPIRPDLRRFLEQWQAAKGSDGYVISFRGKPLKSVHGAWRQALIRAGISRRIRPYDLRHAFATEALEAGADLKAIIELMGHANERMIIRHYRHVNAKSLQTAINRSKALNLGETKARAIDHKELRHGLDELAACADYQALSGQGVASPPPSQGAPG